MSEKGRAGGRTEKDSQEARQHPSLPFPFFFAVLLQRTVSWHCDSVSGAARQPPSVPSASGGGRHAVPVKVKQGRQLWKLVARLWLNTNTVLKGILGLLIMSQGPLRNNPSLRIEIGKWSVKVGRLERIARSATGHLLIVDDQWEIPLQLVESLMQAIERQAVGDFRQSSSCFAQLEWKRLDRVSK